MFAAPFVGQAGRNFKKIMLLDWKFIKANGPAIKGGCVTRRSTGQIMVMFGRETFTVQGGYGACFCRPGTSNL